MMPLRAKIKRYAKQIIPFGVIWLIFALIYSFVEGGILGELTYYPSTGNEYNFQSNLIFTSVFCVIVGLVQGAIEVLWMRRMFDNRALWVKLALKSLFYSIFVVLFLSVLSTLNSAFNYHGGDFIEGIKSLNRFISSFAFWSIVIYISVTLSFALYFSEIGQYLGDGMLHNFLFGKYHTAKQETRIFMFLDMKSSTTIAEKIGHKSYFKLLKAYYGDMTDPILETSGEIYQYVGDEIVVSWPEDVGKYKNNCIECFAKIIAVFNHKKTTYLKQFELVPEFKAGFHLGEVTTGEIGIIKKDIIYTGDVLNTTARIQAECNKYKVKALISEDLVKALKGSSSYSFKHIEELLLRGKKETIQLYSITF